ncbi:MAG: hypothetical protein SGPRY_005956 [Prymnesium sp.]
MGKACARIQRKWRQHASRRPPSPFRNSPEARRVRSLMSRAGLSPSKQERPLSFEPMPWFDEAEEAHPAVHVSHGYHAVRRDDDLPSEERGEDRTRQEPRDLDRERDPQADSHGVQALTAALNGGSTRGFLLSPLSSSLSPSPAQTESPLEASQTLPNLKMIPPERTFHRPPGVPRLSLPTERVS